MSKFGIKQAVNQLRRGPIVGEVLDRAIDTVRGPEGTASPAPMAVSADETRIVPPPPPPDPSRESFDVWGFDDTEFQISPNGHVVLTGTRYSLCGDEMPNFLPWIRGVMDIPIDIDDVHAPSYPPAIPKAKKKKPFTSALAEFLSGDIVDVTTIKELARRWYPDRMAPPKKGSHRAHDDILESIEELRHYRTHVFRERVSA